VLWQATWRRIWRHLEQAGIEMCGACSSVSDEGKAQLAEKAKFCCYSAGEVLLRQGEADNNVFILTEGVVSFSSEYNYSDKNKRLGVGEMFGLDDLTADTTVFAKTDTEVMMIKKADFIAVTQDVLPE
jgi:CRP-like cAMP-binding protein